MAQFLALSVIGEPLDHLLVVVIENIDCVYAARKKSVTVSIMAIEPAHCR